ncbi:MAG TPA: YceI family protein [Candidatus Kapabacteria bacterium]|jgi:polyisoprenoid-binding protein YceI|nr:YceI family protein [Candidatus Kapabacteria bacterium]
MNSEVEVLEAPATEVAEANKTGLTTWSIDAAHSSVGFSVRHMMIANVRGEFREVSGTLHLNQAKLDHSSVNITIIPASIETREPARNAHLKNADFFDVEKYPEITFHSTKWQQVSDNELRVVGDLTMHGVTKEVVLRAEGPTDEVKDPWGGTRIGFSAKTKINRKDFGLGWNVVLEAGGFAVSEEVTIALDVSFVKQ